MRCIKTEQGEPLALIRGGARIAQYGWTAFASHQNHYVRVALANRRDCPETTFMTLASDLEPSVVAAVASNPSCPAHIIEHIAMDMVFSANHYCMVWYALVLNKATPTPLRLLYINKEWTRRLESYTKPNAPLPNYVTQSSFWQNLR